MSNSSIRIGSLMGIPIYLHYSFLAILPFPFAGLQATFDVDAAALLQVLAHGLGEFVPADDREPLRLLLALSVLSSVRAIHGHVKLRDGRTVRGIAHLGIRPEVTAEHHFVEPRHKTKSFRGASSRAYCTETCLLL